MSGIADARISFHANVPFFNKRFQSVAYVTRVGKLLIVNRLLLIIINVNRKINRCLKTGNNTGAQKGGL